MAEYQIRTLKWYETKPNILVPFVGASTQNGFSRVYVPHKSGFEKGRGWKSRNVDKYIHDFLGMIPILDNLNPYLLGMNIEYHNSTHIKFEKNNNIFNTEVNHMTAAFQIPYEIRTVKLDIRNIPVFRNLVSSKDNVLKDFIEVPLINVVSNYTFNTNVVKEKCNISNILSSTASELNEFNTAKSVSKWDSGIDLTKYNPHNEERADYVASMYMFYREIIDKNYHNINKYIEFIKLDERDFITRHTPYNAKVWPFRKITTEPIKD